MKDQFLKKKYQEDPVLLEELNKLLTLTDRKAKTDAELETLFAARNADKHEELLKDPNASLNLPTKAAIDELQKMSSELQRAIDVQEPIVEKEKERIRKAIAEEYRPRRQKEIQELGKILKRLESHNEKVAKTNAELESMGIPVSWPGEFCHIPGAYKYNTGLLSWNEGIEKLRSYIKSKGFKI